jgi:hypothetical protein
LGVGGVNLSLQILHKVHKVILKICSPVAHGHARLNRSLRAFRIGLARAGIEVIAHGGVVDIARGGGVVDIARGGVVVAVVIVRGGLNSRWRPWLVYVAVQPASTLRLRPPRTPFPTAAFSSACSCVGA